MTLDAKKLLKIISVSVFVIFIAVFAFFRSKDLLLGIKIKDVNVVNGQKFPEGVIRITGNAKNAIELKLNGRAIPIDQSGNFSEAIALLPGYNIISMEAKDEFGNADKKNYQLMH